METKAMTFSTFPMTRNSMNFTIPLMYENPDDIVESLTWRNDITEITMLMISGTKPPKTIHMAEKVYRASLMIFAFTVQGKQVVSS